jgi:hypothetical protein
MPPIAGRREEDMEGLCLVRKIELQYKKNNGYLSGQGERL